MGDRTSVALYVPSSLREQALAIIEKTDGEPEYQIDIGNLICLEFFDVNYGELHSLDDLQQAGIAYDSEWSNGDGYGAGSSKLRFTPDGEAKVLEVYNNNLGVDITALLEVIDDHAALKKLILDHKEKVVPLPWDNQEEYGKIYRTKQLIAPTT